MEYKISLQRRQEIYEWLERPEPKPTQTEFRKALKISYPRLAQIKADWNAEQRREETRERREVKIREVMENSLATRPTEEIFTFQEKDYDSDTWLRGRTKEADTALIRSCASGNAASLKLFNQLINRLVEKQEVKIGLTADEIAKRNLEADRRIKEFRDGRGH